MLQLFCWNTQAQSWQWLKKGGSETAFLNGEKERIKSMEIDSENNIYFAAEVGTENFQLDNVPYNLESYMSLDAHAAIIASYGCDGAFRWKKVIGGYVGARVNRISVDAQGNVYAVGIAYIPQLGETPVHFDTDYTLPYIDQWGHHYTKSAFIIKYDKNGVFKWLRMPQADNLTVEQAYSNAAVSDLVVDSEGNSYSFWHLNPGVYANGALTITQYEKRILKYYTNGNYVSSIVLDISFAGPEGIIKMYRNPYNGNFYFTGEVYYSSGDFFHIGNEVLTNSRYVAVFDSNGNYLWKQTNNGLQTSNEKIGLAFDEQGNVYVSGVDADKPNVSFAGAPLIGTPNHLSHVLPYIVKLDVNGNLLAATNGNSFYCSDIAYRNGKLSLGAEINSFHWQNFNIPGTSNTPFNSSVLQFDANTLVLESVNQMTNGITTDDKVTAVVRDSNNSSYIAGYFGGTITAAGTTITNSSFGQSDFFVAKFGNNNCVLEVETPVFKDLNVYPNPVQSQLYINNEEAMQYELYNILGKKIQSGSLAVHGQLDCSSLSSGIYLLKLQNEKGETKIVKVSRL
jgi:hypothetical protein